MAFDKLKRLAGTGTQDVAVVSCDGVDLATGALTATLAVRARGRRTRRSSPVSARRTGLGQAAGQRFALR